MERRIVMIRSAVLGVLLLVTLFVYGGSGAVFEDFDVGKTCAEGMLCVFFLDVGQGDATLIESPSGMQVLIDAGPDGSVMRELAAVLPFFDRDIDMIVATHPDKDHVGGFVDVLERYDVTTILRTENESDTAVWEMVEKSMDAETDDVRYVRRGQMYDLGGGAQLEILFPDTDPTEMESNTSSIVARLTYGETSFLLTGDSPKSIEEYLVLRDGEFIQSDVLKVGHHGSDTSTSELFLAEVDPTYAVISAGKDNSYGHPHVSVTDMLFNYGVETYGTYEKGTIQMESDGIHVVPVP